MRLSRRLRRRRRQAVAAWKRRSCLAKRQRRIRKRAAASFLGLGLAAAAAAADSEALAGALRQTGAWLARTVRLETIDAESAFWPLPEDGRLPERKRSRGLGLLPQEGRIILFEIDGRAEAGGGSD